VDRGSPWYHTCLIDLRFGSDCVLAGEGVEGVGLVWADRWSGKPLFPVDCSGRH